MRYVPPHPMRRRRPGIHSPIANITLMPASLLPFQATYRRVANQLPTGSVLILTPPPVFSKQQHALAKAAQFFRTNGHLVRTLPYQ